MEEGLRLLIRDAVLVIEAMAFFVVALGTAEAFVTGLRAAFSRSAADRRLREIWLRYGRWLVAGLTFQLAADIIATSIAPNWQEIGQLGAIAVIRTFLNFFLARDLVELRNHDAEPVASDRIAEQST